MSPTVGYSGTPLPAKLGIKAGSEVALINAPADFEFDDDLPPGVSIRRRLGKQLDVVVYFVTKQSDLRRRWPALTASLTKAGGLWVAFPKKASRVVTDMTDHAVRAVALPTGWVDNKVCAIDETWTGVRCVLRVHLR